MKLSGVLAVSLSASIPGGAFAQNLAGAVGPAASPQGSVASGAVQTVPSGLGALAPLSLSAASITPSLTPAPGVTPVAIPAAAQPPTVASLQIEKMTGKVGTFFKAAETAGNASPESSQSLASQVFGALTGGQAATEGVPAEVPGREAPAAPRGTLTQQKMIRALYQVAAIFSEQYAPIDWKRERFSVDLKREYDKVQAAILAHPQITTREFQDLLTAFVAGMHDYHVSISYNSTERARLPFLVIGAEGKHFLAYIDREKLPLKLFPFRVGDEVVAFDGKPTAEAVNNLAAQLGGNTAATDLRLAEIFLTNRRRSRGDTDIPNGNVVLGIRGRDGKLYKIRMPWDYTPELIPQDVPVRDAGLLEPGALGTETWEEGAETAPRLPAAKLKSLLDRAFTDASHPLARLFADMRSDDSSNPFMMGARKSFVPRLGTILWETKEDDAFHAYIFKTPDGRKVGFIRIPSYEGGAAEVARFAKIMAKFQKETSALVIDQVSNPGGAIFYLYALASHLTDKTLLTPRHRVIIGESDAQWAADLLLELARPQKDRAAAKASSEEADEWTGYPVTPKFILLMLRFAQFILAQLEAGHRFTPPTHLWGVDDIDPAPRAEERYTKPILLLTNALDFSGGDFFPAILQDNTRATVMGVRTSGAGGAVKPYSLPNQFGIERLSATWTIALRADGQPIENLGVTPDIAYDFTAKDLRTGFAEYRHAILKALTSLIANEQTPH